MKVGKRIWVRASKSLGTPRSKATVVKIIHQPGGVAAYPDGLLGVVCDDENKADLQGCEFGTTVDFKGCVYSGPPCNGYLVMFP